MRVLSVGTERKLFERGSPVLLRQKDYALKTEELHIIVFALKSFDLKEVHDGKLHIYPTNSSSRLSYVSDAIKIGRKILSAQGKWVISTQDPFESGLVGRRLKKEFNIPLQVQVHTDFLSPYFKNSFLNKIRASFLAPKVLTIADGVRVVSSVIQESLKRNFPEVIPKIDILPIFVDIDAIIGRGASNSTEKTSILMASRFSKEKRIDIGLKVIKKVLDKLNQNINMTIIGSGPEKNNILNQIDELEIRNYVKVSEWESDVISAYKQAQIFLLTSEYEGYGMTLIEAGAVGCPIVTTDVGVAKTSLFRNGENAFVCPVGDVDCLSKSASKLLADENLRKSMAMKMQESVRNISMSRDEYVSKYVGLLEKLVK